MTRFARRNGPSSATKRKPEQATPWSELQKNVLQKQLNAKDAKGKKAAEEMRKANYDAFLEERSQAQAKTSKWAEFPGIKKSKNVINKKKLKEKALLSLKSQNEKKKNSQLKSAPKTGEESASENEDEKHEFDISDALNSDSEEEESGENDDKNDIPDDAEDSNSDSDEGENDDNASGSEEEESDENAGDGKNEELDAKNNISGDAEELISDCDEEESDENDHKTEEDNLKDELSSEDEDMPEETSSKVPPPEIKITKKKTKKNTSELKNPTPNKDVPAGKPENSSISDEIQKKIEKKKQKRIRQLEKKKLKKAEQNNSEEKKVQPVTEAAKKLQQKKPENQNKQVPKRGTFNKGVGKSKKFNEGNKKQQGEKRDKKKLKPKSVIVNGKEIPLVVFEGFPIKSEDAERLKKLRQEMVKKGLPKSEIDRSMKFERRKAEKALAREKKKVCFKCRKAGHVLSGCPELGKGELIESSATGVCFKCGSGEHTHFECKVVKEHSFKFAQCFICKEQGHIARQCPQNDKGLYPKGGACRECGDVTHFRRDCPRYLEKKKAEEDQFTIDTTSNGNPDDMDTGDSKPDIKKGKKSVKPVRYFQASK